MADSLWQILQCDRCRGELTSSQSRSQSYASPSRSRSTESWVLEEFSARVRSRVIIVVSLFATRNESLAPEVIRRTAHRTYSLRNRKENVQRESTLGIY